MACPISMCASTAKKRSTSPNHSCTAPNPSSPLVTPRAVGITPDGSKVLFSSRTELTDDANTGELEGVPNQFENLYLYDVNTKKLTDLTVDNKPVDERRGAGVVEVLRTSEDFSYVYFVATGDLAPGATSGDQNIYVWHEGKITFIGSEPGRRARTGLPGRRRLPDGKHFIFLSPTNQTAYDSAGKLMVYKYVYGDAVRVRLLSPERRASDPAGGLGVQRKPDQRRRQPRLLRDRRQAGSAGLERGPERLRVRERRSAPADARRHRRPDRPARRERIGRRRLPGHHRGTGEGRRAGLGRLRRPRQRPGAAGVPLGRMPG